MFELLILAGITFSPVIVPIVLINLLGTIGEKFSKKI